MAKDKRKRYRINSRNLLAASAIGKRKNGEQYRYDFMHVSGKGTIATNGYRLVRVSLPKVDGEPQSPYIPSGIIPVGRARELAKQATGNPIDPEPELEPCGDRVPDYDKALASYSGAPQAELYVNAALLGDLLRACVKFSDDPQKLIRLRVYAANPARNPALRIDAKPTGDGQELLSLIMGVRVSSGSASVFPGASAGSNGEAPGEPCNLQAGLMLPETSGRLYRAEE